MAAARDAALEQAHDAVGDDARLAGAGAGEDEERAVTVLDGIALGRIQACSGGHASVARTLTGPAHGALD